MKIFQKQNVENRLRKNFLEKGTKIKNKIVNGKAEKERKN